MDTIYGDNPDDVQQTEREVAVGCEYCGRPSAAIRVLVEAEKNNLANYDDYVYERMRAVAENLKRVGNGDDPVYPVDND